MATPRLWYLVVFAAGCNTPTYLPQHRPLETMVDPTGMTGGYVADTDLYVLPVRKPTSDERTALTKEQQQRKLPMPVPWVATRDFSIEIEWSMKNLENKTVNAMLTLNGGNEFGDYQPNLYVDPTANVEDQTPPPPLLGGEPIHLTPNQTYLGVFREDQVDEASLDLEAITRYPDMAAIINTPFQVIEHNSTASTIGLENIPHGDVTPLMCRFQWNLSADGHVVVDYTVRVREHTADKLADPKARGLYVSTQANLPPPVMPPMAGMMMMP